MSTKERGTEGLMRRAYRRNVSNDPGSTGLVGDLSRVDQKRVIRQLCSWCAQKRDQAKGMMD